MGKTKSTQAGRQRSITVGGNSCETVKSFKYLGSVFTNQSSNQEEMNVDIDQEIRVINQPPFPF